MEMSLTTLALQIISLLKKHGMTYQQLKNELKVSDEELSLALDLLEMEGLIKGFELEN
jgi:DNA-binding Lrp family transcriptional regulator